MKKYQALANPHANTFKQDDSGMVLPGTGM